MHSWPILLLLQSALNPCGFWPAQLSLSILSRKVFTECRCQRHVKPSTWRTSDLERPNSLHQVSLTSERTRANPSSGRWKYGRKNCREFCRKWRLPRHFWVLLHAVDLRHGTDGFTSPPKEGALRIFSPTVHSVEFYYICPTGAQYLFLKPLLHIAMFIYHPQGVSYYVR
jgi:hypothetical protein